MKLTINFGFNGPKKEINWFKSLMDFPKLLRFQGNRWEWSIYHTAGNDYELTFSQLASYDPNFYADMPSFEEMFEWGVFEKCECGASYTTFPWDHLKMCKKWKPWDQL